MFTKIWFPRSPEEEIGGGVNFNDMPWTMVYVRTYAVAFVLTVTFSNFIDTSEL